MNVSNMPCGIDASNNNGTVNWLQVAGGGYQFAFMKATEGTSFHDSFYPQDWHDAKAAGLYRGAYHFGRPSVNGPEDEASFFASAVLGLGLQPGDMVALDLEDEDAGGALADWALRWMQRVEALVGFPPLLYTSPGYAVDHLLARAPELGDYGLWLADWGLASLPEAPPPWSLVAFWQYAVSGADFVPGVSGPCDLNRFNGDVSSIPLYGKPGAGPTPVPVDPSIQIAELTAQVASLTQQRDGLLTAVAYLGDSGSDAMTALAKEWQRVRVEQVGQRP